MNKAKIANPLNNIDTLILCGGLGLRLRSVVSDRPKVMACFGGKPLLEIITSELLRQGLQRIIFCTGHLSEQIEDYFKSLSRPEDVIFEFSREERPLGTGGALKNAIELVKSEVFFVMNGDSLSNLNLKGFYLNHIKKQTSLSIALVEKRYRENYGNVTLTKNNQITSFIEKNKKRTSGLINIGCYLMNKSIKEYFPAQDNFSLEYDLFPKLTGKSYGFIFDGKFLDIGTPERYVLADDFLLNLTERFSL